MVILISVMCFLLFFKSNYKSEIKDEIDSQNQNIIVDSVINLTAEELGDSSVKLVWEQSKLNIKNEVVSTSYSVYEINGDEEKLIKDNITVFEFKINDLKDYTLYAYKVKEKIVVDGKEVENESDILEVLTLPKIVKLNADNTSDKTITLTWDKYRKLDENTNLIYEVYGANEENENFELLTETKDTVYKEKDIKENQTRYYYIKVVITKDGSRVESADSKIVSATVKKKTTTSKKTTTKKKTTANTTKDSSLSDKTTSKQLTQAEKEKEARKVAREIVSHIKGTDELDRIRQAAMYVGRFASQGEYTSSDKDYRTAYGVLVKGVYTCAGTARALGMVLEEMGYKWQHINANKNTHQWVELTVNGQKVWADAFPTLLMMGKDGMAGYGDYPY